LNWHLPYGVPERNRFGVLKIPVQESSQWYNSHGPGAMEDCKSVLFDLAVDPGQTKPVNFAEAEARLSAEIEKQMHLNAAPPEAFKRLGFTRTNSEAE